MIVITMHAELECSTCGRKISAKTRFQVAGLSNVVRLELPQHGLDVIRGPDGERLACGDQAQCCWAAKQVSNASQE